MFQLEENVYTRDIKLRSYCNKRKSSIQLSTLYKGDKLLDKNYFKIMWFTLAFHKMEKPWLVNYQGIGLLWI